MHLELEFSFQKINFNEKNTIISEYRVALRIGRMFGQQRDGQGLQLGHHSRLHVRRRGDHRGHHSGHLHQYDHGGRDDRFRILLALRLRRRGQLVRGGRSRPDRLQPLSLIHI